MRQASVDITGPGGYEERSDIVDWAEVTLTNRCNQRCFFCYEDARENATEPAIEDVKRLIERTKDNAEQVVLCGKEVLLRRDVCDIIEYAVSVGLRVAVFSNGQQLARDGLVQQIADAGAGSIVVSFHFPDAEVYSRGARIKEKGFYRQIEGFKKVSEYLLANPDVPMDIATESDMFALNVGRLAEMRQTMIDAFGAYRWKMRIASLMPCRVYDIGLDHVLGSYEARRIEIRELIDTQPPDLPLNFVKLPLCVLPPEHIHRCLDVQYVYEGTVLTYNHMVAEEITLDPFSMSSHRNIVQGLDTHPYRWVCRRCNLVPACRFERVDWHHEHFEPNRDQKPTPFEDLTLADVFRDLGPENGAAERVEPILQALRNQRFPEETLIDALYAAPEGAPRLVDAWVEYKPILMAELEHRGHRVRLQISPPERVQGEEPRTIGALAGYLDIHPAGAKDSMVAPADVVLDCIRAVAAVEMPPGLDGWEGLNWFNARVASLFRSASHHFGESMWPGRGAFGDWRTFAAEVTRDVGLRIELEHEATGARATVCCEGAPDWDAGPEALPDEVRVVLHPDANGAAPPPQPIGELLDLLGGLLGAPDSQVPRIGDLGVADACFVGGEWKLTTPRPRKLVFEITDKARAGADPYEFEVTTHHPDRPCFKNVGKLALSYGHRDMDEISTFWAKMLLASMKRLQDAPPARANVARWEEMIRSFLDRASAGPRFAWTVAFKAD